MAGFRRSRRASGAAPQDGHGSDTAGVAPVRRGRRGSSTNANAEPVDAGAKTSAAHGGRLTDERIVASRPRVTAVEHGLAMLASRSFPEKILHDRIRARYTQEETDAAMARLRELRLVDDAAWAERYTRDRFERLGKGRHRIRMELLAKGIEAATVDAALDRAVGGDDERAKAAAMLDAMRGRLAGRAAGGNHGRTDREAGAPQAGAEADADHAGDHVRADPRERRKEAERLKNRLFRRMLARGFPAGVVRDLLDVS